MANPFPISRPPFRARAIVFCGCGGKAEGRRSALARCEGKNQTTEDAEPAETGEVFTTKEALVDRSGRVRADRDSPRPNTTHITPPRD